MQSDSNQTQMQQPQSIATIKQKHLHISNIVRSAAKKCSIGAKGETCGETN